MGVEDWFSTGYKAEWHKVWDEGRAAASSGVSRDANPHWLIVWKEVWWYGWDNYDPMPEEFRAADENLKQLPLGDIDATYGEG